MVTNLRYADDTYRWNKGIHHRNHGERENNLSKKAGLLCRCHNKDGGHEYQSYWGGDVDGKIVEDVTSFMILGVLITRDGVCDKGIRRRIAMGKAAMGGLTTIWKDRRIKLATKVIPMKALVFPIALYGAETWTLRTAERKNIDAFEMWCWRRVMRVSLMERKLMYGCWKTSDTGIEGGTSRFGQVVREERGMENDVRRGVMSGKRRLGRPITRCQDNEYTVHHKRTFH